MLKNELAILAEGLNNRAKDADVHKECHRIRTRWTAVLLSALKEEVIRRYARYQQEVLLEIADDHMILHQPALLSAVLDLNHFLLRYFKTYLDPEMKIPDAIVPDIRKQMKMAAERLRLVEDPPLRACLMAYSANTAQAAYMSYRQKDYFFAVCDAVSKTEAVGETLFTLNFNHPLFCRWQQAQLEWQWKGLTGQRRLDLIKKQLIAVKSTPLIAGTSYDPRLPSVVAQTENWLMAVISQETEQAQKLGLQITVAQLALLIRLLSEEGYFASQNIAELLRFFATHCTTKKQTQISYGSMNKLYYSADQFTAFAIRAMLLKMVARINKMFFPN